MLLSLSSLDGPGQSQHKSFAFLIDIMFPEQQRNNLKDDLHTYCVVNTRSMYLLMVFYGEYWVMYILGKVYHGYDPTK